MFITIVVLVLMIGYLTYIVLEKIYINKIRKSFKYLIHVNGIRGKSTTTRLIDAGFRACGYKVFSKTTGTKPMYINTNNEDVLIKRWGNANIREQIQMMRRAYKEGAEVLILECMAVKPDLQKISEEMILRSDCTVITNVRADHLDEMGSTLEDIAYSFSNTIPNKGILVCGEDKFLNIFEENAKKKDTKVMLASEYDGDNLETFKENIACALEVAKAFNLDVNKFFEGMKNYHHDIGAYEKIKYDNTIFLNGFYINDPESIRIVYNQVIEEYDYNSLTILLNSRFDRPSSVVQHIELLSNLKAKKILIYGSNPNYIIKRLKKNGISIEVNRLHKIEDLNHEDIIFAIGNIGGKGMKILEYFRKNGEKL